MEKLQRNYKLTIHRDGDEAGEIVIEYPITVEFSIRRDNLSVASDAEFRIYNLSKEHRTRIFKNPWEKALFVKIDFEAGYGDKNNLSTAFSGNILWARSSRAEGAKDYITTISAYDYGMVTAMSFSNFTVQDAEASQDAVIKRLCKDLGYIFDGKTNPLPIGAIGTFDKTERTRYSVCGNSWEALKEETGKKCFIDNGKIYCLDINEATLGEVSEISLSTGLLGSPRTDGQWVIIDTIFEPGLKIGQQIKLTSISSGYVSPAYKDFDNTYKIVSIEHSGTISGAVSGKCKTTVTLMPGSADPNKPLIMV